MKRMMLVGLLVIVLIFGAACGSGDSKPDNMSDEAYNVCLEMIELTDKVIEKKSTATSVAVKIGALHEELGKCYDDSGLTGDLIARTKATALKSSLSFLSIEEQYLDTHGLINELAELLDEEVIDSEYNGYDECLENVNAARDALVESISK